MFYLEIYFSLFCQSVYFFVSVLQGMLTKKINNKYLTFFSKAQQH